MASLPDTLRRRLEKTLVEAREVAEAGARAAIERLAVGRPEPFAEMAPAQRELRVQLRAHARQLGDSRRESGEQETLHLVSECAYEHWHRMLFARFLTENRLLIHPEHGVPVTLAECEELAAQAGETDGWRLAGRFAARMLPAIFRPDDPVLSVRLAPEHQQALEALLAGLPAEVFTADDSLGWVYQFWQAKQKDEVNKSGKKIGADELPAVTQLFTEPYMVKFLLHNTLGAWWASKVAAASSRWSSCATEADCRRLCALPGVDWEYLRFVKVEAPFSRLENTRQDAASTEIGFYRKNEPVANLSGNLPHWRQELVTYFVTFRTADSLPQEKLRQWQEEKEQWMAQHPEPHDEELSREYYQRFPERIEYWLDQEYGACQLNEPALREIVQNALCHFDSDRYYLDRFVVSGNHVHVLVTPRSRYELSDILHSWKSFTANHINRRTGQSGAFWQKESFDHIVRNPAQLERLRQYIGDHEDKDKRQDAASTWRPAAGTFDGWPQRAAEISLLESCCGSGHFLVEAFRILVPMRMAEEEGLSAREACEAVLRDNLFGLEIDERCTQIAAFNLALAAWKYVEAASSRLGGTRQDAASTMIHIACSGLSVGAREEEWLKLAGKDERLREGMRRLYRLFQDAPTLGSLIDPRREFEARPGELEFDKGRFDELRSLLEQALAREEVKRDAQATEVGIVAQGMAKAAVLLAGTYTLVITNVPYLGRGKQDDTLKDHLEKHYNEGKADLATAFVLRCLDLCQGGSGILPLTSTSAAGSRSHHGTAAMVTPQNWLFLTTYTKLRESLLKHRTWKVVARLGPGAFETIGGHVVNVALLALSATRPGEATTMAGIDVSAAKQPDEKAALLRGEVPADIAVVPQAEQLKNPDATILLSGPSALPLFKEATHTYQGIGTADAMRYIVKGWELPKVADPWVVYQMAPESRTLVSGCHSLLRWEGGAGTLCMSPQARVCGQSAWGKTGIAIAVTASLPRGLFLGCHFDCTLAAIIPDDTTATPALAAFVLDDSFAEEVRNVDQALSVTESSFGKVPFDLAHWQQVAAEKYPHGLPEPESDDPTQWLFHGRPEASTAPLQVAVARLLGYRWPAELDETMRLSQRARELVRRCGELLELAAADGIVCIPPVRGDQPAADRLQRLLSHAFGAAWTPATLSTLLDQVGFPGTTLEDWLRDGSFEQHCQLFHQRPFVWHIWDGRRRGGFAALVNYHKLDRRLLERLAYTVLGDWIARQRQGAKAGERGAEDRLAAAETLQKKLALILEGEPPHDIFVRWKALHEQPIGWEPDLNDGVRMNIRPFVEAGVLRRNPNIKWTKDRGAEPQSLRPKDQFPWFWKDGRFTGERVNDVHLANADKRAARKPAAGARSC